MGENMCKWSTWQGIESESEVAQSYLTLSDLMDCSLPGSSVHGIFQARVLEWDAIAFSGQGINLQNIQTTHVAQYQENKQPNQKKKWVEDINRHFSFKEGLQMAKKKKKKKPTHEKMLNILIITEMQIQTAVRYQLILVRMAIITKSINNKCWRGCEEKGIFLHCWWECKVG